MESWGLWGRMVTGPKSSVCMAEHTALAREMLDCKDRDKAVKVSPC